MMFAVPAAGLPKADPRFVAHFTNPIYDTADDENDDLAPFGTDEGSDELRAWAGRLDDLRVHPTLRHMLGADADEQIEELRQTLQVDVDDILIGRGFTLLRFTGQIDPEGRRWLIEALQRQNKRGRGGEYAEMLRDLSGFEAHDTGSTRSDKARRVGRTTWLVITGSNDEQLEAWFQQTARAVRENPPWVEWWSTSKVDQLVLYPSPVGPPGVNQTTFDRRNSQLQVVGSSAELSRITWSILAAEEAGHPTPPDALHTPEVHRLLETLIYRLLRETGDHLNLTALPNCPS
jgi:uncharacterized protein YfeS